MLDWCRDSDEIGADCCVRSNAIASVRLARHVKCSMLNASMVRLVQIAARKRGVILTERCADAIPKKRGPKTDVLEALLKRVNGLEKRLKDEDKESDDGVVIISDSPTTTKPRSSSGSEGSMKRKAPRSEPVRPKVEPRTPSTAGAPMQMSFPNASRP